MDTFGRIYKYVTIVTAICAIASIVFLRFYQLGYSDYVDDEHSTFLITKHVKEPLFDYLTKQRKGPLQNFVSHIPYLITHDFGNTTAERIPYALFNLLSLLILYKALQNDLKDKLISSLTVLFLGVNGLIVAFGRIVQYQNLNLFFSFSSLLCFINFRNTGKITWSLLGTASLIISLYAHWDAAFILFPISWIVVESLLDKNTSLNFKGKVLLYNFIFVLIATAPFFIPYIGQQSQLTENHEYLFRRLGFIQEKDLTFKTIYELYNPLFSFYFFSVLSVLSIPVFTVKKVYRKYLFWLVGSVLVYLVFMKKPGTHVYNLVIPMIILSSSLLGFLFKISKNVLLKILLATGMFLAFTFMFYQSFLLFVDHTKEYPWQSENILKWQVPTNLPNKNLPLFGFPHKRYWDQVNTFVVSENKRLDENYGYATNEDISHTKFYMDVEHKRTDGFYYVVIKRPITFVDDWKGVRYSKKTKVLELSNLEGESVVKIFKVRPSGLSN